MNRSALLATGLCAMLGCGGASANEPDAPVVVASGDGAPALPRGGPPPATPEEGRGPTPTERAAIDRLTRSVSEARGLRLDRPVLVEVHSAASIGRKLVAQLEADDLDDARLAYGALGLLDPDVDLLALLSSVLTEQVVGYYDPDAGRLVVRDDIMRTLHRVGGAVDEGRVVLAHELVHALQDQALGLGESYDRERDSDADNAFRAVVEGDATLAMLGYAIEHQGGHLESVTRSPGLLRGLLSGGGGTLPGDALAAAPPILRVTLVTPYLDGTVLAAEAHRQGGWAGVDALHHRPPASTEQVLHLDKLRSREAPVAIAIPGLPGLAAAGLTALDDDTLGELEMSVYFGQLSESRVDATAAAGWGGDRLRIYRDTEGGGVAVWFTVWDSERDAAEAEVAAEQVAPALADPRRPLHRVLRQGKAVLIVRGLATDLQPEVVSAFTAVAATL